MDKRSLFPPIRLTLKGVDPHSKNKKSTGAFSRGTISKLAFHRGGGIPGIRLHPSGGVRVRYFHGQGAKTFDHCKCL